MNEDDIKKAIDKLDMILHPHYFYMNPADYNNIPKELPEYGYIFTSESVEKGNVIVIDRAKINEWMKGVPEHE